MTLAMRQMTRMTRFAPALLLLALSGCISFGGKPPKVLLNLTPAHTAPAGPLAGGRDSAAIAVLEPSAELRLAVTRVPVQVSDSSVAYLKGATWVERPTHLIQHLIAETLRAKGGRPVVEGDPGVVGERLSGRLIDLGYDARTGSAVVRIDVTRQKGAGSLETRRFEQVVPGVPAEASAVGAALNQAANAVAGEVADWVA